MDDGRLLLAINRKIQFVFKRENNNNPISGKKKNFFIKLNWQFPPSPDSIVVSMQIWISYKNRRTKIDLVFRFLRK